MEGWKLSKTEKNSEIKILKQFISSSFMISSFNADIGEL